MEDLRTESDYRTLVLRLLARVNTLEAKVNEMEKKLEKAYKLASIG